MAIEDAYVLAGLLSRPECRADNVEAFLDAYERVRRPRAYEQLLNACETGEVSVPTGSDLHSPPLIHDRCRIDVRMGDGQVGRRFGSDRQGNVDPDRLDLGSRHPGRSRVGRRVFAADGCDRVENMSRVGGHSLADG